MPIAHGALDSAKIGPPALVYGGIVGAIPIRNNEGDQEAKRQSRGRPNTNTSIRQILRQGGIQGIARGTSFVRGFRKASRAAARSGGWRGRGRGLSRVAGRHAGARVRVGAGGVGASIFQLPLLAGSGIVGGYIGALKINPIRTIPYRVSARTIGTGRGRVRARGRSAAGSTTTKTKRTGRAKRELQDMENDNSDYHAGYYGRIISRATGDRLFLCSANLLRVYILTVNDSRWLIMSLTTLITESGHGFKYINEGQGNYAITLLRRVFRGKPNRQFQVSFAT